MKERKGEQPDVDVPATDETVAGSPDTEKKEQPLPAPTADRPKSRGWNSCYRK